jgi:hypothetical protein
MKKILIRFMALSSIGLLMLSACKKDGALVTSNGGKAGTLTASTMAPTLDKAKVTDTTTIVSFSFTAANYGFAAGVTNTLQIDAAGDNWKNPATFVMFSKVYSQGFSTPVFNNLLLKLNLPAGTASQVNVRVEHTISPEVAPIYSNVLALTVTPFNLSSWLYVTGRFASWNNPGAGEDSLESVTGNGIYTGIINFNAPTSYSDYNQFLILPAKNWSNKYATSGTSTPSTTVTYNASNNFNAPTADGMYIVTVNLNAGTISFAAADYYSVIGDGALGWNPGDDVPMKYINDGSNTWTVTTALSSSGSIKVREDDAWTWSWGIPKPGTAGDGVANTLNDSSNNNIPVPANGNYNVSFIMAPTAFGGTPPVTTTYSLTAQ